MFPTPHTYLPWVKNLNYLPISDKQKVSLHGSHQKVTPLTFLHGRKDKIISVAVVAVYFSVGSTESFPSRFLVQAGLVLFGKEPPQKATPWLKQVFVCGRCVRDVSIPSCHRALCSLCPVVRRRLTPACLSVQNGNVCCSVDLECLTNNWRSQTGLCRGSKTEEANTWNEVVVRWRFIQQTITKVSAWGRCLGVAFGTFHYAHPC